MNRDARDRHYELHDSIAQFHKEKESDDQLAAEATPIQALLAQGKVADAKSEADKAAPIASGSENLLARRKFALADTAAHLASGKGASFRSDLHQMLREAQARGYVRMEFKSRPLIAQIERKAGHTQAALVQLAALEKSTHARGFERIAKKAAAARA